MAILYLFDFIQYLLLLILGAGDNARWQQYGLVSYADLWSFDEINAVKCTERLLPLPRGRLGGGRFSLLTPAFDVQEIMLTLAWTGVGVPYEDS